MNDVTLAFVIGWSVGVFVGTVGGFGWGRIYESMFIPWLKVKIEQWLGLESSDLIDNKGGKESGKNVGIGV